MKEILVIKISNKFQTQEEREAVWRRLQTFLFTFLEWDKTKNKVLEPLRQTYDCIILTADTPKSPIRMNLGDSSKINVYVNGRKRQNMEEMYYPTDRAQIQDWIIHTGR